MNTPPFEVSGGENHTAILSQLYMLGSNQFGQLGIENQEIASIPTIIPSLRDFKITQVSCGGDFTFAVTSKNEVFSWGVNLKGQLGLGDYLPRNTPTQVFPLTSPTCNTSLNQTYLRRDKSSLEFTTDTSILQLDEKVSEIACGGLHTLIRTDKGRMLAAGFNGTFAICSNVVDSQTEFKEIEQLKGIDIERIAAGLAHSACIRNTGEVLMWGVAGSLQSLIFRQPCLLEFQKKEEHSGNESIKIMDVRLGDSFSLFLDAKGDVYVLGDNIDGQLGLNNSIDCIDIPCKLKALPPNISHISCGRNHAFAISNQGKKVYGWGSNQFSQISPISGAIIPSPIHLQHLDSAEVFRIICGCHHTCCLSYHAPQQIEVQLDDDSQKTQQLMNENNVYFQKINYLFLRNNQNLQKKSQKKIIICNKNQVYYNPRMINIKCKSANQDLNFKIKNKCYKQLLIRNSIKTQIQIYQPKHQTNYFKSPIKKIAI